MLLTNCKEDLKSYVLFCITVVKGKRKRRHHAFLVILLLGFVGITNLLSWFWVSLF